MKTWEIERLFNDDVREKRKTGSGQFHRRGKGVKHGMNGALRTSYYYMTNKERKKLNGEVRVFNMYETILTRAEFDVQDKETQKMLLTKWRDLYENKTIMEQMGIHTSSVFHKYIKDLEIPKKPRGGAKPNTGNKRKAKVQTPQSDNTTLEIVQEVPPVAPVKPILITNGLNLEYNGEFDAEHISKVFTKLQLLIEGEENKFNVCISITERT